MGLPRCISFLPPHSLLTLLSLLFLVLSKKDPWKIELGSFISWHCLSASIPTNFCLLGSDYYVPHSVLWPLALSWGVHQVGQLPDWTYSLSLPSAPWLRLGFSYRKFLILNTSRHEQCNCAAASKHSPQQELLWQYHLSSCHLSSPVVLSQELTSSFPDFELKIWGTGHKRAQHWLLWNLGRLVSSSCVKPFLSLSLHSWTNVLCQGPWASRVGSADTGFSQNKGHSYNKPQNRIRRTEGQAPGFKLHFFSLFRWICFLWKTSSWTVLQSSLIPVPHPDQLFLSRADAKKTCWYRTT